MSGGEDRDIVGKESNNCIVVESSSKIVNVEQEKKSREGGSLR